MISGADNNCEDVQRSRRAVLVFSGRFPDFSSKLSSNGKSVGRAIAPDDSDGAVNPRSLATLAADCIFEMCTRPRYPVARVSVKSRATLVRAAERL